MPYYQAAGEKMLEAKPQVGHGNFESWIKRNFGISKQQATHYMRLAEATSGKEKSSALDFSSLSDPQAVHGGDRRSEQVQGDIITLKAGRGTSSTYTLKRLKRDRPDWTK